MAEEIVKNYINNKDMILKEFEEKFESYKNEKRNEWIESAGNIPEINLKVTNWENVKMFEFEHILEYPDINVDHLIHELQMNNQKNRDDLLKKIDSL